MIKLTKVLKRFIRELYYMKKKRELSKVISIPNRFLFNRQTKLVGTYRDSIIIEDNVMVYGKLIALDGGKIRIGENTSIREGCIIYCAKKVEIGKNVIFSDNIIISDTNHHPVNPNDRLKMIGSGWSTDLWSWKYSVSKNVTIKDNVWIGQYSRILKGVTVGENSIIASNSVVTKDVPPNCIAAGNPARIVKSNIINDEEVF